MHGHNKLDVTKALKLREQGLSNAIIAKRLDITTGAVYAAFRKYDEQRTVCPKAHDRDDGRSAGRKPPHRETGHSGGTNPYDIGKDINA